MSAISFTLHTAAAFIKINPGFVRKVFPNDCFLETLQVDTACYAIIAFCWIYDGFLHDIVYPYPVYGITGVL